MPLFRSRGWRPPSSDVLPQPTILQTRSRKRRAIFVGCAALVLTVLLVSASAWGGTATNSWQRQLLSGLNARTTAATTPKLDLNTNSVLERICRAPIDPEPDHRKQNPTQCMPIAEVLDDAGEDLQASDLATELSHHEDQCGALLQMPKVALMFLTRGPMPHEELWNRWLASAAGLVAVDCASASLCSQTQSNSSRSSSNPQPSMQALKQTCTLKRTAANAYLQQHMFSIYIHPPPDFAGYDPSSVFYNRELPASQRLVTKWGHHSTTEVRPHSALFQSYSSSVASASAVLLARNWLSNLLCIRLCFTVCLVCVEHAADCKRHRLQCAKLRADASVLCACFEAGSQCQHPTVVSAVKTDCDFSLSS